MINISVQITWKLNNDVSFMPIMYIVIVFGYCSCSLERFQSWPIVVASKMWRSEWSNKKRNNLNAFPRESYEEKCPSRGLGRPDK